MSSSAGSIASRPRHDPVAHPGHRLRPPAAGYDAGAVAQHRSRRAGGAGATGRLVQITALVTVLSLAPSLLVMVTAFTRIVIVLSLLRSALSTQSTPPNMVLIGLALFLTFFVMQPVMNDAWTTGILPLSRAASANWRACGSPPNRSAAS